MRCGNMPKARPPPPAPIRSTAATCLFRSLLDTELGFLGQQQRRELDIRIGRRRCGRPAVKLHPDSILWGLVSHLLRLHWSPEQIALALACLHPSGHEHRVSYETIYNCIYAIPVGELRKELIATLRHAHNKRVPRSKGKDGRGQIPDMLSIHVRPPEIEDRQFPGHWEGDLIKGEANASAVGTLVERTSRRVMLVKLPEFKPASAANVLQGFTDKLLGIAQPMRLSMT